MAYNPLPIVEVGLDQLRLDLENYRIPSPSADEQSALKYLFSAEEVTDTARMILRDGYFDNEVPIVMRDSAGYIVLEGNRRVAALKALLNPSIVPPAHEREILALLRRYAAEAENLPTKIRVLVAPSREAASRHIARLHTGLSKRPWSRDQQATFYYSLLDENTTVDDVKALYPGVDVVRFIKMAVVRRFLQNAPFQDMSLREYARGDALKMSVFEYAYRNQPEIADVIGIAFDRDGHLLPRDLTPEQIASRLPANKLAALEYLLNEFRAGRLNTRSAAFRKNSPEHVRLLTSLVGQAQASPVAAVTEDGAPSTRPGTSGRQPGPTGATGDLGMEMIPPLGAEPGRTRGPNHPDTRDKLDLTGVDYENTPVNLKDRYLELRKISLSQLPVAAALLLRSILECTIKHHFEQKGERVVGELRKIIPTVAQAYGQVRALQDSINTIQHGTAQRPGSINWFNNVSHNGDAVVKPDDVRQAWRQINPLIRHLLRPPVGAV